MATLKEIVTNIIEVARNFGISDDEKISERHVAFLINYYRALFIRRDLVKGRTINPDIVQTLGCVELKTVDAAECCNVSSKCDVLRTIKKLPKSLEIDTKNMITFVGSIHGNKVYQEAVDIEIPFMSYAKYTSRNPKYLLKNGYLYILANNTLKYVQIRGIFEDPREAVNFIDCNSAPCFDENGPYPIASWMIPVISKEIWTTEFKIALNSKSDTINDASGEIKK